MDKRLFSYHSSVQLNSISSIILDISNEGKTMKTEAIFKVVEIYGHQKTSYLHVEKLTSDVAENLSDEECVELCYEEYSSRIEDGYLPLIPSELNERDWEFSKKTFRSKEFCYGEKEIDGIITLEYENSCFKYTDLLY